MRVDTRELGVPVTTVCTMIWFQSVTTSAFNCPGVMTTVANSSTVIRNTKTLLHSLTPNIRPPMCHQDRGIPTWVSALWHTARIRLGPEVGQAARARTATCGLIQLNLRYLPDHSV